ncbi:UNVERIFIED_CONTAM: hypothetical protein Sangu_1433000 [Sesamum angustifolium]|uniref:Uncharacterized protein n=1 Tax=Sesamum angustifolium TaxID=2727405 RepID=A0AAW2N6C5_9LAMI
MASLVGTGVGVGAKAGASETVEAIATLMEAAATTMIHAIFFISMTVKLDEKLANGIECNNRQSIDPACLRLLVCVRVYCA